MDLHTVMKGLRNANNIGVLLSSFLFALSLTIAHPIAQAEEVIDFELDTTSLIPPSLITDALVPPSLSQKKLSRLNPKEESRKRQATTNSKQFSLTIPLAGSSDPVTLYAEPYSEKQLHLVLLDRAGNAKKKAMVSTYRVTNFRDIYGTLVISADKEVYATLLNRSAAEPSFWNIAPVIGNHGSKRLHRGVRLSTAELVKSIKCGVNEPHLSVEALVNNLRVQELSQNDEENTSCTYTGTPASLVSTPFRAVQLVAVSSGDFTQNLSDAQVSAQIAAAVASANLFLETLHLELELVGIQTLQQGPQDPYLQATAGQNSLEMLQKVQEKWEKQANPEHDLVAVFAKSGFNSIYGLSYAGASCVAPGYSFLFATQGGDSAAAQLSLGATLAHEVGHFVGMTHDGCPQYPGGASLMWPYYVTSPTGFSGYSISQYQAHAGSGKPGSACFSEIAQPLPPVNPPGGTSPAQPPLSDVSAVSFVGSAQQTLDVNEGQVITHHVQVAGDVTGMTFSATGLPAGATMDLSTGVLSYTPDFSTANKKHPMVRFKASITAKTPQSKGSMSLTIRVHDVNRSPQFTSPSRDVVPIQAGRTLTLAFSARDPDAFDRVKLKVLNQKSLRSFQGQKSVRMVGNKAIFRWKISSKAGGDYLLSVQALDRNKASTVKNLVIQVKERT